MVDKVELPDLLGMAIGNKMDGVFTTLPAMVVSYDDATQKAVVQPLIKRRDRDGDNNAEGLVDMAVISGVPILFPSVFNGGLFFPIKPKQNILLHFCSRSIDNYMISQGDATVDPQSYRTHNYSDCFATIGMTTFPKALGSDPSDCVLVFNSDTANENKITLKANGDVVADTPAKFIINATGNVEVNTDADAIVNAGGNTTITSGGDTTIDCGQTTITGEVRIDGGLSVGSDVQTDAGFSANTHKHIGNLSKPTSAFI